jgi:DNA-binding transcriptional ArsR family regulator
MASITDRTLSTEAEISAYLHRSRMAILDALRDGPATTTQIAARLEVHPANLTRHIRILEEAGLVALVEKRDTGRNLEKYYAATARRFRVAPGSGRLTSPHKIALTFARSELSAALARLPDELADPIVALALSVRIAPSDARSFADEMARMAERFSAADRDDGQAYQLVLAIYPGEIDPIEDRQSIRLGPGRRRPDDDDSRED